MNGHGSYNPNAAAAFLRALEHAEHSGLDHAAPSPLVHDATEREDRVLFDGPPIPLTRRVSDRPSAFPVDAFPKAIGMMVEAVAHALQTDAAMPATSALSALAACAGGRVEVEVRSGWREPLCLYTATVAAPGERKSAVQVVFTRPILDAEDRLAAKGAHVRVEAESMRQVAVKRAEQARNMAATATVDQDAKQSDAISAAAAVDQIRVPVIPRIVADDVTPEATATLLAEQRGRLAILSAEGGIFDIIAGRYSRLPNLDVFLKGHAGDPMKVDRKGRPPEYIPRPALTLGLMIQPAVLADIGRQQSFRGRGLLARFLYALPVSKVGRRQIAAEPVPAKVEAAYRTLIGELAEQLAERTAPVVLDLTASAKQAVCKLETEIEPMLAPDGELAAVVDWGAKYVGAVVRIAGLLHLARHGHHGVRVPVDAQSVAAAAAIGAYYRACAVEAFDAMQTDQDTADAVYLAERLAAHDGDTVTARGLHRISRGRFRTRTEMNPALARLIDHGFLCPLPLPEPTGGRPAPPRCQINVHWTR